MAAANVLKGGGALLLSRCSCGGGHRNLLTTRVRGSWKWNGAEMGMVMVGLQLSPSLFSSSSSSSFINGRSAAGATALRRLHCSASRNVVESSSSVPESSSSSTLASAPHADDDHGINLDTIKNAANTLDVRVGLILKAWRHPEADSLYVEEVDVGEPQPRLICSGLVNYIPLHQLQDKKVIVLANLKPRNMRGIKSYGMLMAASDASHENVELLMPPESSVPGERVWFGSIDEKESLPDAASPNQIQKKKIWESVQPHLKTEASCVATLGVHEMRTSAGAVSCRSLKNANIS